jgi:serine/threonine protein kinase
MAPEIVNSPEKYISYTSKCDIYSLGCIIYELYHDYLNILRITLKQLFPGDSG